MTKKKPIAVEEIEICGQEILVAAGVSDLEVVSRKHPVPILLGPTIVEDIHLIEETEEAVVGATVTTAVATVTAATAVVVAVAVAVAATFAALATAIGKNLAVATVKEMKEEPMVPTKIAGKTI